VGLAAARPARRLNVDRGRQLVSTIHLVLASTIAIVAVIGMFGTGSGAADPSSATAATRAGIPGTFELAILVVLPLAGVVAFGVADWQLGRGAMILRAGDVAAFALGMLDLSLGATGLGRFLAGAMALLAAGGLAGSIVVTAPRRPGWRR